MSSSPSSPPAWRSPKAMAIAGIVVVLVAAVLLVGRFGPSSVAFLADDTEEYCTELEAWNDELTDLGEQSQNLGEGEVSNLLAEYFKQTFEAPQRFVDIAPDEVDEAWRTYGDATSKVLGAAKDAGYDLTDPQVVSELAPNEVPPELTEALTSVQSVMQDSDVQSALDDIVAHADETCGVTIERGLG